MSIDPRRLLTFREVVRCRSFSRAAEELSLTQSAVSQQIAALERQVGTPLLVRGPGGLRLTPPGERLQEHAEVIAGRLALAEAQVADDAATGRREVRLGAFPSALATIVPAAVSALLLASPELDITAVEGRTEAVVGGVRDGSLHIAVAFQDAREAREEHDGARRHDLLEEPMVAVLPPRHRLAGRKLIDLLDLAEETWTAPTRDGLIARTCERAGFTPRVAFLSSDPLSIRAIVAAGLAVTLTPQLLAGHLHDVQVVPVRDAPARRAVYALLPDTGARQIDRDALVALEHAARSRGSHDDRPWSGSL